MAVDLQGQPTQARACHMYCACGPDHMAILPLLPTREILIMHVSVTASATNLCQTCSTACSVVYCGRVCQQRHEHCSLPEVTP